MVQGTNSDLAFHKHHISANLPITCYYDICRRKYSYNTTSDFKISELSLWDMAGNKDENFLHTSCSKENPLDYRMSHISNTFLQILNSDHQSWFELDFGTNIYLFRHSILTLQLIVSIYLSVLAESH